MVVWRGAWLSTFPRDAMRIMCLSLAGRWWRAEWETGLLTFGRFEASLYLKSLWVDNVNEVINSEIIFSGILRTV